MQPDKLSCGSDNLPGPLVVVLVVETVNTLRMIDEGQGGVFGQCFGHKAIDRIKHRWNFIVPGAGNEHWRDFARIGLQVSDRRKRFDRFRLLCLTVVRLLDVHKGVEAN